VVLDEEVTSGLIYFLFELVEEGRVTNLEGLR
jgi:hypothetical protein